MLIYWLKSVAAKAATATTVPKPLFELQVTKKNEGCWGITTNLSWSYTRARQTSNHMQDIL